MVLPPSSAEAARWDTQQQEYNPQQQHQQPPTSRSQEQQAASEKMLAGMPIRRVRHAEIVLVDDVCIAFGRYWLRLRWPGQREGFAGYIAMGVVNDSNKPKPSGTYYCTVLWCHF